MSEATVKMTVENRVAWIEICNERKRNAFTHNMTRQLDEHLHAADQDRQVRVVVIRGQGEVAFSAGHDLSELTDNPGDAADEDETAPFLYPRKMRKPVIAAVNGFAYAGGLILAQSCDIRIASSNAKFAGTGAKLGLVPIGGQLSLLPALMAPGIALEIMFTGEALTADRALTAGFVNQVVESSELEKTVRDLAERIAANAPLIVETIKEAVWAGVMNGFGMADAIERFASRHLDSGPDALEGVRAFSEKRAPVFKGDE